MLRGRLDRYDIRICGHRVTIEWHGSGEVTSRCEGEPTLTASERMAAEDHGAHEVGTRVDWVPAMQALERALIERLRRAGRRLRAGPARRRSSGTCR